jgi:uncharacterized protein with PIN domain
VVRGTRQAENPPGSAARFRFHAGLGDLLVRRFRADQPTYRFRDNPGIKDAIEAMGIPHTEVDVILANGLSVNFSYPLQDDDKIDVYPVFSDVPVTRPLKLSPCPPDPATFVLDVHLGKLARRLRLLGFDACYRNEFDDAEIMAVAEREDRIILTRDLGILKHRKVRHGYLVRSDQLNCQLREILKRYDLSGQIRLWARCMTCNGLMEKVNKADVELLLEPKTRLYYEDFHRCSSCGKLYWKGSHYARIDRWLNDFMKQASLL